VEGADERGLRGVSRDVLRQRGGNRAEGGRRGAKGVAAGGVLRGDDLAGARSLRLGDEVDGADGLAALADAVGSAVALVELHGIPREVVVDHGAGALEVEPL